MGREQIVSKAMRGSLAPRFVDPRRLLAALLAVQVAINVAYAGGRLQSVDIPRLVNLDAEANLPAWWSSLLLAALAVLILALAFADEERSRAPLWLAASAVFLLLSLDESAGLHERFGNEVGGPGVEGRVWVLIIGPIFLLIAVALVGLLQALTPSQRRLAVASVVLYATALVVEALSNWSHVARGAGGILVEENAEMLASGLLIVALAGALLDRVTINRIRVR